MQSWLRGSSNDFHALWSPEWAGYWNATIYDMNSPSINTAGLSASPLPAIYWLQVRSGNHLLFPERFVFIHKVFSHWDLQDSLTPGFWSCSLPSHLPRCWKHQRMSSRNSNCNSKQLKTWNKWKVLQNKAILPDRGVACVADENLFYCIPFLSRLL